MKNQVISHKNLNTMLMQPTKLITTNLNSEKKVKSRATSNNKY
jgi:hypothetical protein